jgi:hypothetical protein
MGLKKIRVTEEIVVTALLRRRVCEEYLQREH